MIKTEEDNKAGVVTIVLHDINEIVTLDYESYHNTGGVIIIHKTNKQQQKEKGTER